MKPLTKLTNRQAKVLELIADHIQKVGYPPTIRELGDALGIRSTNGVNDHLKALEKKGYLSREDAKSRTLRPLFWPNGDAFDLSPSAAGQGDVAMEPDSDVHQVPVVGRIAAGLPISAIEQTEEVVAIGEGLLGRHPDLFALRVKGESMIEDGIFDGDYIFVRKQSDVRDGVIVAAMVDGEATVKRLFREKGQVRLQPANASMEPIYVREEDGRDTSVLGAVVGVFRRLN
nr:transcriptional repressor LexA [Lujinxingia sediminis]